MLNQDQLILEAGTNFLTVGGNVCLFPVSLQTELLGKKGKKKTPPLKEEAAPTIFSCAPVGKKVLQARIDRAKRRTKQDRR